MNEESIFAEASEKKTPTERAAFLEHACGDNTELRKCVESLLEAYDHGEFLESPAPGIDATIDQAIAEQPGSQIGPYKLLQQLGEGGMGVVYMAEQTVPVERRVALKIIKPGMDSRRVIARFEAERQALALMDHPNIAKVLDAATTDSGRPYFVMELVKGVPITKHCDEHRLSPKERLELFIPICQAVQHAHQKGIIHRDLKPSNVLVALFDGEPVPKVIDFGIAKATSRKLTEKTMFTQYGQIIGTLEYMSPEQAQVNQLDVDTRSDIYSLGVMLYELLTGVTPFDRERLRSAALDEMMQIIRDEDPPRPSMRLSTIDTLPAVATSRRIEPQKLRTLVRGELDWIVMKALEKDRGRRYETANGFAADIQRYLEDAPVAACPPSAGYRFQKFARRNRAALVTASMIATALMLGMIGTSWEAFRATRAEKIAHTAERNAAQQRDRAITAEQIARRQAAKAIKASKRASIQLQVATVMRKAAQSGAHREEAPITSILLALESVEDSREIDATVLPIAHEALLSAVSNVGGRPLVGNTTNVNVSVLAISHDGRWVVTGHTDHTLHLWDLHASEPSEESRVLQHNTKVTGVAIGPQGRWLLAGHNDGAASLWDLTDASGEQPRHRLSGHNKGVTSVAIGPSGRWLATASRDTTVRLWDMTARDVAESSLKLSGHTDNIVSVAISPNGHWLVSAGWDRTARLWDLTSSDPSAAPHVLRGHQHEIWPIAISPDSHWLATGDRRNVAGVWDLFAEDPAASPLFLTEHENAVRTVAFGPESRWLATGSFDRTARLWDLAAENPNKSRYVFRGHESEVRSVLISPDGRRLVTGCHDEKIRVWDLDVSQPDKLPPLILRGHDDIIYDLKMSANSRWLVTVGYGRAARLWDLESSTSLLLSGHQGAVNSLALDRYGRWLATGSDDHTAQLWRFDDNERLSPPVKLRGHGKAVSCVAISPDGRWLATGSWDNTVRLWDLTAKKPETTSLELHGHTDRVACLAIGPDSRWLASGSMDKTIRLWDLQRPQSDGRKLEGHTKRVMCLDISPNGRWLASGSADDTARLWELSDTSTISSHVLDHADQVAVAAFSPDSRWLGTGSWDGVVRLWKPTDAKSPAVELQGVLQPDGRPDQTPAGALTFSADNRWLATGNWSGYARVWDLVRIRREPAAQPSALYDLTGHAGSVHSICFSPNSRLLVTGGDDNIARVWDLSATDPTSSSFVLRGHRLNIPAVAMTPDGRTVITASNDNTVRLWDVTLEAVVRRAHSLTRHKLSRLGRKRLTLEAQPSL